MSSLQEILINALVNETWTNKVVQEYVDGPNYFAYVTNLYEVIVGDFLTLRKNGILPDVLMSIIFEYSAFVNLSIDNFHELTFTYFIVKPYDENQDSLRIGLLLTYMTSRFTFEYFPDTKNVAIDHSYNISESSKHFIYDGYHPQNFCEQPLIVNIDGTYESRQTRDIVLYIEKRVQADFSVDHYNKSLSVSVDVENVCIKHKNKSILSISKKGYHAT